MNINRLIPFELWLVLLIKRRLKCSFYRAYLIKEEFKQYVLKNNI